MDPAEIGKNAGASIPLVGDIRHVFRKFLEAEPAADYSEWTSRLDALRTEGKNARLEKHREAEERDLREKNPWVNAASFLRRLSLKMEDNAVYLADVGQNQLWSCANVVIRNGRLLTSGGMGTMGYAVPAAMGAKLADPKRQVIAVCGDGGFQMTMMELATMKQYGIQAKVIVLKNRTLGLVHQYQHLNLEDRFSIVDLGDYPNLEMLTRAYDMHFILLKDTEKMEESIDRFLQDPDSVLMEVDVNPDELA